MKKLVTLLLVCSMFAGTIHAGGFQLNEQGARAMALAGAFTGLASDPSAIYFNPAGITQLKGTQFYAGATMIMPLAKFTGPKPSKVETEMISQIFNPINLYVTQEITDKLSAGISVNNQYGLGTKWDKNWVGRELAVDTEIITFFITPVVAYEVTEDLSVSVGGIFALGDVTIQRMARNPVTNQANVDVMMEGDGTGYGFTAGLLYKLSEKFQLGLSYRSEVAFDFKGTVESTPATFSFNHPLAGPMTIKFPTGNITAPLSTPQNITLGLAYMADERTTVTADFQYVGWSSYDKLAVTFENYNPASPTFTGTSVTSADRKYENTFIVRAGLEYKLTDNFFLRGGLLYDNNPVLDDYVEPTLPDADRVGLNVGFGGKFTEHLGIDFAYMYLSFAERTVGNSKFGFNGAYQNSAHLLALNFSYSL